jgi:FKBP-type peptidyl-prolyl cis-trans isomerase FkpA
LDKGGETSVALHRLLRLNASPHPNPAMSDIALAKGEKFLEDNSKKEGVVTTASGLQYKVLTEGTGKSPKATDTVLVHYEGTLIDGKVFDSSYRRGEPIEFPLNRVIAGWTEGVQLMKEGAKFRFYIPSRLAYGPRGAGRDIGPNEALIFDVELLKVG